MVVRRAFLIVLDSFGIGAEPDAGDFGDAATVNTLASVASSDKFHVPNLQKLGLFNIDGVSCGEKQLKPAGAFGRMQESSRGKDTTVGHWEIAGVITDKPLPTYPQGFPPEVVEQLETAFGRKIICNKPYSGMQVIHDYGKEHLATGALIVYTSADSVLQIAAHESIVPPEELYDYCRKARQIMTGAHGVGRIIARPFEGDFPNYVRTPRRHDYSIEPPQNTLLDMIKMTGNSVISVGKINDIFAGRGISRHMPMVDNQDGMAQTIAQLEKNFFGLCFTNLVDFDMKYGHRRDVDGYAQALTDFDVQLGEFLAKMKPEDLLIITADHGCDPKAAGTDHTREYVPVLFYGAMVKPGINVGTRATFADLAASLAGSLRIPYRTQGTSFWYDIKA